MQPFDCQLQDLLPYKTLCSGYNNLCGGEFKMAQLINHCLHLIKLNLRTEMRHLRTLAQVRQCKQREKRR